MEAGFEKLDNLEAGSRKCELDLRKLDITKTWMSKVKAGSEKLDVKEAGYEKAGYSSLDLKSWISRGG